MTGQFVFSGAGHDKGSLYVVLAGDERFVYLADGCLKKPEKPKKKCRKHIQPVNAFVEDELKRKLETGEPVRSEEIKYAIRRFAEKRASKKVEEIYVEE